MTPAAPSKAGGPPPSFSPQILMDLFLKRRHDELSESFLATLRHFHGTTYVQLDHVGKRFVDGFVKHFLTLFTEPGYVPSAGHLAEFVGLNLTIANLVAMSSFGTTDPFLDFLKDPDRPAPLGKILALTSARNHAPIDRKAFFDADPALASIWYGGYAEAYRSGMICEGVSDRLHAHFAYEDDRLDVGLCSLDGSFASTYVGGGADRQFKPVLNRLVRRLIATEGRLVQTKTADPKKIAVISGNWAPAHSVYRICYEHVKALAESGYHLTLVPLNGRADVDTRHFHDFRPLGFDHRGIPDLAPLQDNDFMVAYYPDVGLTPQSVVLANLRIAPVQVATHGHSVSTWGSRIDYFISGRDAEIALDPQQNYSERLVLLPGSGVVHNKPLYLPLGRVKSTDALIINGPWNAQKVNHRFGRFLAELVRRSDQPLRIRLFVSSSLTRRNDFLPFARELQRVVGRESVEVVGPLPYRDYMALMEEGDWNLDSFPFGGCNTVVDGLFLRKPTICLEGGHWYNRIGPQILRAVGLPELVATSESAYLDLALRLIGDDAFRTSIQSRLEAVDLDATLFDQSEALAFSRVIGDLIAGAGGSISREAKREDRAGAE